MDTKKSFEAMIGFVILLLCSLFIIHTISVGKQVKRETYSNVIYAKFRNIDGIKIGSDIKISGVRVGVVNDLKLSNDDYSVNLKLSLKKDIKIPDDSIISIRSDGLLGGKFLDIKPGVSDNYLNNNDVFSATQSAINLEDLIGKVVASFTTK